MTPEELREQFLSNAKPILDEMQRRVLGLPSKYPAADNAVLAAQWETLEKLILQADDTTTLTSLADGTATEKVETVIAAVATGELTVKQGKRLIEMLQEGFEITELPKMILALDNMEKK